jgi:hypothetical protein
MRSHVSVFGRLKCDLGLSPGVEVLIDYLGEFAPEAADLNEIIDAGTQYSLQAAECFSSSRRLTGPKPGWFRVSTGYGAWRACAMSRDRETMRFVAHALNQVQCTGVRGQYSGVSWPNKNSCSCPAADRRLWRRRSGDSLRRPAPREPWPLRPSCPLPPSMSSTSGLTISPSRTRL